MESPLKHPLLVHARHLAQSMKTPVLLADNEGCLVFYNAAAGILVGRPFEELGPMRGRLGPGARGSGS